MNTVKEILHDVEAKMKKTVEATHREFNTVRTGRASPALVEGLKIDYYGQEVPIRQIAGISTPDARLIVIQPWDPTALPGMEKAIMKSDIGITPNNDGKIIRLSIPPLTQERREELVKLIKKMLEDGKISLRTARHSANDAIDKLEKDKKISEDDKFNSHKEAQKLIEKYTEEIDTLFKAKEEEITSH